ncbi:hypothetical protein ACHAWF_003928 [Thalassiosira exigua]
MSCTLLRWLSGRNEPPELLPLAFLVVNLSITAGAVAIAADDMAARAIKRRCKASLPMPLPASPSTGRLRQRSADS